MHEFGGKTLANFHTLFLDREILVNSQIFLLAPIKKILHLLQWKYSLIEQLDYIIFVFSLTFSHVCLLLKRGTIAHLHSVDEMGKVSNHRDVAVMLCRYLYCGFVYCQDALDIAVEQRNADIVTLLRLAKFNDDSETVDERQNKTCKTTTT